MVKKNNTLPAIFLIPFFGQGLGETTSGMPKRWPIVPIGILSIGQSSSLWFSTYPITMEEHIRKDISFLVMPDHKPHMLKFPF